MTKKNFGFTLIELLVVVVLIGLLTSIGVFSYSSTNQKARDGRRQADLEQIRTALEIYRADNGVYPADLNLLVPDYTKALPSDPKDTEFNYYYTNPDAPTNRTYQLCAHMEVGNDATELCGGNNECGGACNYKTEDP